MYIYIYTYHISCIHIYTYIYILYHVLHIIYSCVCVFLSTSNVASSPAWLLGHLEHQAEGPSAGAEVPQQGVLGAPWRPVVAPRGRRRRDEKCWENHGKTMGKWWFNGGLMGFDRYNNVIKDPWLGMVYNYSTNYLWWWLGDGLWHCYTHICLVISWFINPSN